MNPSKDKIIKNRALESKYFESKVVRETKDSFEEKIFVFMDENEDVSTMEAILHIANKNDYEIEFVAEILSDRLKEELKYEAANLNMVEIEDSNFSGSISDFLK